MSFDKNSNIKAIKNKEKFEEDLIIEENVTNSIYLFSPKQEKQLSSNSLDFDIISEEEINKFSKNFNKKTKDKTDKTNSYNNTCKTKEKNNFNCEKKISNIKLNSNNNIQLDLFTEYQNKETKSKTHEYEENEEESISKINILKESILVDEKFVNKMGVWNALSSKFSNFKNFLKYNVINPSKQLKILELKDLTIFDKFFKINQSSQNEVNLELSKIFLFTYRTHFRDLISKDGIIHNTDCGWGCMIRAAQMMLSKAFLEFKIFNLGKHILLSQEDLFDLKINVLTLFFDNLICFEEKEFLNENDFSFFFKNYPKILNEEIRKFHEINLTKIDEDIKKKIKVDKLKNEELDKCLSIKGVFAPFSIQNVTKLGILFDVGPGVWFSDSKAIKIFKEIENQLKIFNNELFIFSFDNGVVNEKQIFRECFEEIEFKCYEECKNTSKNLNHFRKNEQMNFNYNEKTLNDINMPNFNIKEKIEAKLPFKNMNLKKQYEKYDFKDCIITEKICEKCLTKLKFENQNLFDKDILEIEFPSEEEGKIHSNNNSRCKKIYLNINDYYYKDNEFQDNRNIQNSFENKSQKIIKRYFKLRKSGFIFVSVRHGINSIEKEYHNSIKEYFKIPYNLGIIGGKANSAYYFIGVYQEKLIYLDPHFSQKAVENLNILYRNEYETYQPKSIYYLDIKNLSPSFTMGFYFRNINEYNILKSALTEHSELQYRLFSFEKIRKNKKYRNKDSSKKPEEIKYKEIIEDDFSVIDLDDDF